MTDLDLELVSQYLDGELPEAEASALERRLAHEPDLRDGLERLRRADEHLRAAANVPGCDRVPPHITAMLSGPSGNVLPFPSRRGGMGLGLAVAASLVAAAGLLLAPQWRVAEDGLHPADARGELVASALESTASSADQWVTLADGSQLRPVLSFAAGDQWCREYQLNTDRQRWHGVACRTESGWHTQVLVDDNSPAAAPDRQGSYIPAGAGDLDSISSFIQSHATDIPLSTGEEAALIARQWQ